MKHPGRRGMARLLAGRMVFQSTEHERGMRIASHTYRNPDRAAMHPGKAAKKFRRTVMAFAALGESGDGLARAFDGVAMTTAGLREATRNLATLVKARRAAQ